MTRHVREMSLNYQQSSYDESSWHKFVCLINATFIDVTHDKLAHLIFHISESFRGISRTGITSS